MKKVILFSGLKKLTAFAMAAVMLMSISMLTGCGKKVTIDFSKCVSVDFSGYNGEGTVNVNTDAGYIFSLLGDMNAATATEVVASFSVETPENNGKLSNGDKVTLKVNTNEDILKNAKVAVTNTELEFTASGFAEKEKLDVFSDVSLNVTGISPECSVTAVYNGSAQLGYSSFKLTRSGSDESEKYKNGDTVTVELTDETLEALQKQYIIDETSREYTVKADSAYILSAADLDEETTKKLSEIADNFLNEQVEVLRNNSDFSTRCVVISGVSGESLGALAASSSRIDKLENVKFNSAYVGATTVTDEFFGSKQQYRYAYYFYDADVSFTHNAEITRKISDTVHGILVVRIEEPKITDEGITYKKITINSEKDFDSAYKARITEDYDKIS